MEILGGAGRFYWGRREVQSKGIVVGFAWMSSDDKHLKPYVKLYASLGWNSLICHANFLNLFFPEKATSLAFGVLDELLKELKIKPCAIVFASFSGGPKACMYKALQIIQETCEGYANQDAYQLVRQCICGQIYDSSPVDFTSDLGTHFFVHPTVLKMAQPPRVVSWIAKGIASGLDALFLTRFEEQRAEYWQTLYSSVRMGPFLILCSEDDDLCPFQTVCNFAQRLLEIGGDVKLVKWKSSPHVGHYRCYPIEYKEAVAELLDKSATIYLSRMPQLEGGRIGMGPTCSRISESVCNLHKAAVSSNQSLRRVAVGPSDHFFLPSSVEFLDEGKEDVEPVPDEHKEGGLVHLQNHTGLNAQGVLGKMLFDVCVPKNIEGWDIKAVDLLKNGHPFASAGRRHPHFNPIKCMRRSKLAETHKSIWSSVISCRTKKQRSTFVLKL